MWFSWKGNYFCLSVQTLHYVPAPVTPKYNFKVFSYFLPLSWSLRIIEISYPLQSINKQRKHLTDSYIYHFWTHSSSYP